MKYTHDISRLKSNRNTHFKIGLIIALVVVITALNFTVIDYDNEEVVIGEYDDSMDDIMPIPPITREKKVMPPPPKIEEVDPIKDLEDIEIDPEPNPEPDPEPFVEPTIKKTDIISNRKIESPVVKKEEKKAEKIVLPPPPPPVDNGPEFWKVVEQMPRFVTCDGVEGKNNLKKCSDKAIIEFIQDRIKYPAIARENNIEGTVYVRFIVEKDGSITGHEILKEPGGGLGAEAMRVIKKMPTWEVPGKQRDNPVRVQFTMPVKFKLAGK